MARFADLPVELWGLIVKAACEPPWDVEWMLALSRTSRTIYSAVQPMLYETVCISKNNHASIFSTCKVNDPARRTWPTPLDVLYSWSRALVSPFARDEDRGFAPAPVPAPAIDSVPFRHTRQLIMVDWDPHMDVLAWAFSRATAFAGTIKQLEEMASDQSFAPTMLVVTAQYRHVRLETMPALRNVTHLHMCVSGFVPDRSGRGPIYLPVDLSHTRFTHVMIDYHNDFDWRDNIVPVAAHFLAVVTLQRLLLCIVRRDQYQRMSWAAMTGPLIEFVHTQRDTRVRVKPIESSCGSDYYKTCPCVTGKTQNLATVFDCSKWLDGEPLYQPPC